MDMISPAQDADASKFEEEEEVQIIPLTSKLEATVQPEVTGSSASAKGEEDEEEDRDRNNNILRIEKAVQEYLSGNSKSKDNRHVTIMDKGVRGRGQVRDTADQEDEMGQSTDNNAEDAETSTQSFPSRAKEIWTSFSRSLDSSLYTQAFQVPANSKLGSFLDRLSIMTEDTGFSLPNFIVAGIASNLKKLGVEEIDCKEHVEAWLSQRHQRPWTQSLGRQAKNLFDSNQNFTDSSYSAFNPGNTLEINPSSSPNHSSSLFAKSDTPTIFSPSQPNSSLLRLTGDGDVQLGRFLTSMEEVRHNLNNATCTVLQACVVLTLPYLKLLSGDQLDNGCIEAFTQNWIQIVTMLAQDLKSESMKEVDIMITREYRTLRGEAKKLHKTVKKLHKRIVKICQENDKEASPALQRLQPKRLPNFRGRRNKDKDANNNPGDGKDATTSSTPRNTTLPPPEENFPLKNVLFAPIPLNRANLSPKDLYKCHIFFAKSKRGYLVFKKDIGQEWKRFCELNFSHRRELFLHVTEDLHCTLKLGFSLCNHLNELFILGYPESVSAKLQENLKYLRDVSKESDDLLMLSKVTIANQVKGLQETLARLVQALENLKLVSKSFNKAIKLSGMAAKPPKSFWNKRKGQRTKNAVTTVSQLNSAGIPGLTREYVDFDVNLSLRFDDTGVKLLVPYPRTMNPFSDQFCKSAME